MRMMKQMVGLVAAGTLVATSLFAGTGFSGATGGAKKYSLNNNVGKNSIAFLSDAPMEKINGTADGVSGSFTLDPANLEATKGTIEVKVKSMTTVNSKRDDHMYSDVWLGADKYPTITYEIQSLKDIKVTTQDGRSTAMATAVGTFTMHGVTKPLTATVTLTYLPESAETKKRATGNLVMVNTQFNVALKDYKVEGKSGVVGSAVGETIQVSASLYANS